MLFSLYGYVPSPVGYILGKEGPSVKKSKRLARLASDPRPLWKVRYTNRFSGHPTSVKVKANGQTLALAKVGSKGVIDWNQPIDVRLIWS